MKGLFICLYFLICLRFMSTKLAPSCEKYKKILKLTKMRLFISINSWQCKWLFDWFHKCFKINTRFSAWKQMFIFLNVEWCDIKKLMLESLWNIWLKWDENELVTRRTWYEDQRKLCNAWSGGSGNCNCHRRRKWTI